MRTTCKGSTAFCGYVLTLIPPSGHVVVRSSSSSSSSSSSPFQKYSNLSIPPTTSLHRRHPLRRGLAKGRQAGSVTMARRSGRGPESLDGSGILAQSSLMGCTRTILWSRRSHRADAMCERETRMLFDLGGGLFCYGTRTAVLLLLLGLSSLYRVFQSNKKKRHMVVCWQG